MWKFWRSRKDCRVRVQTAAETKASSVRRPFSLRLLDSMSDGTPTDAVPETKETGFIAGDDSWTRWRNTFTLLKGGLTPEGKQQYRKARDDHNEEADIERCEKYRDYLLQYSMLVHQNARTTHG